MELFASRGDRVTFLYEKNHAAAKAMAEKTGATAICCDVADGEAVNRAFARMGDVDILVCNAGTMVTRMWGIPSRPSPRVFLGRPFLTGR